VKENNNRKEGGVFEGLPEEERKRLGCLAEHRVVASGTIIYRQKDPGDSLYIIRSGKARVHRCNNNGSETDLSLLGAGDSFGEVALMLGTVRSAGVQANEETELMVLSKEEFDHILKEYPDIPLRFARQVSEWLMMADRIIEEEVLERELAPRSRGWTSSW
jgi:CRP/FNR family transcriptional regulator, cyclic AMP receptor protein